MIVNVSVYIDSWCLDTGVHEELGSLNRSPVPRAALARSPDGGRSAASHVPMAAYRSELPHDGVHGVSFGNAAPSPQAAPSAPLLAPLLANVAHFLLVLVLLAPLWLTALYAWQRSAARTHGSLRRWQDATPPAHRRLLLPLKALVWATARHVDSRLPPRLSQARGHALVPSEEDAADVEAGSTAAAGTDPAAASWHAGMLAALAPTFARAPEAAPMPPVSTGACADQPAAASLPLAPDTAPTASAGAGRRRIAREPQVLAAADLEQSPMGTQLALEGVAAIEAGEEDRAAAAATAEAAAAAAAVAAAAAAERNAAADAAADAAAAAADAAAALAAERELAAATAAAAAEKAERDVVAKKREAENFNASTSLGMAFLD